MLTKIKKINQDNLINFLISLIPLTIIVGNSAINLNIILICLLGLNIYRLKIFKLEKKIYQYLIYAFFFYLILITLVKNLPELTTNDLYKDHIIKSFFFLRFLILFLVINKLIEKNNLNINLFFISCSFFSFILCVDILVQVILGTDLIGNPITKFRPSGFFGSEHIAGGYIQKFSLFFISLITLFFLNLKNYKINFFVTISFLFFLVIIILTANRMSALIYLLSGGLFLFTEKKIKSIFFLFILFFILIFLSFKLDSPKYGRVEGSVDPYHYRLNIQIKEFYLNSIDLASKAPELFYFNSLSNEEIKKMSSTGYLITFNSGAQVWKKNKIFGGGLKSFRLNCRYGNNQTCNTHPHNYVLEILVDTGVVGLALIYLIVVFSILDFIKFNNRNLSLISRITILPFFLIIFFEFFPIRSTGSFFTTANATVIFFMLAALINISKLNLSKKI